MNRDGIGVSATRGNELLGDFIWVGSAVQEADLDSVCVEEEIGKDEILRFSIKLAASTLFHAPAFKHGSP